MTPDEMEVILLRMVNELGKAKGVALKDEILSERLFPSRIDNAPLIYSLAEGDRRFTV